MKNFKQTAVALVVLAVTALQSVHAALPTALEPAIAAQQVDLLALIAIGGLALFTVAGAGVVWNVGAKFLKRIGGKA